MRWLDPSADLHWFYPEEAARKLGGVVDLLGIDLARRRGRPLPNRHQTEILGRLVRALFLDVPVEEMTAAYGRLSPRDAEYLHHLLATALAELERRQAEQPAIPLAVPRDKLGTWSNLLAASWIPKPDTWELRRH